MKELEKILSVFLIIVIALAIYFGNGYFKIKGAMNSIKIERRTHKRIVKNLKNEIVDLNKTIDKLKLDKIKLEERLTFMRQDESIFPDMDFIKNLAKKLSDRDTLDPRSQLGKIYIGKIVLAEKQEVEMFFVKKENAILKFSPLNIISRAEFSLKNPKNKIIEKMKHKNRYMINFIGKIASWDGRLQFVDCRITGIWDLGNKK